MVESEYNIHLKNIILMVGLFTGFVFIITFSTIYVSDAIKNNNACGCVIPIPVMILILSSLGVFVGAITSYLFLIRLFAVRENLDKQKQLSSKLLFRLLEPDERKVIKFLVKNNGTVYQSKISSLLDDRVKAYRIISRLKDSGLIKVVKDQKTNLISMEKDLIELLK